MKRSSAELKAFARCRLQGRYTLAVEIVLSYFALVLFFNWISLQFFPFGTSYSFINTFGNFVVSLFIAMLSIGSSYCFLSLNRGLPVRISDLFFAFRYQSDKALTISIFYSIIMMLLQYPVNMIYSASVLFGGYLNDHLFLTLGLVFAAIVCLILSILLWLNFSMCYYIYIDRPQLSALQIIKASFQMMRGNKVRLFYLYISFIGMLLLGIITCFIGMLWVIPYISATTSAFYQELNGELPPKTSAEHL